MPNIRFKLFENNWIETTLHDISLINPSTPVLPENFIYIDLDSVNDGVLTKVKKININEAPSRAQRYLHKGDILFQTVRPYQMNNYYFNLDDTKYVASTGYAQIRSKIYPKFLYYYLHNPRFIKEVLRRCTGTSYPSINSADLKKIKIKIPSSEKEKMMIGNLFANIDQKRISMEKKYDFLKLYKKGFIQQIFSQEIRFKNSENMFSDWKNRKLSDFLFEHKLKSTDNEEVYSVSVHKGLVNQIEHLGRDFSSKNTSKYNLVKPGDIVYTKSPTGEFPLGIIKQSRINKDVIVSPLYGVFSPETFDLGYILNEYFESEVNTYNYLHPIVQKGAKNTMNISNKTFLSKTLFVPTDKNEQKLIHTILAKINKKIDSVEQQLEKIKEFKKYLLQQMFV